MELDDDVPTSGSLGRPFMVTRGRTEASSGHLVELETMVQTSEHGRQKLHSLDFEARKIIERCDSPLSVAEISAHVGIPTNASQVLVTELVELGLLDQFTDVANVVDIGMLAQIRDRIANL